MQGCCQAPVAFCAKERTLEVAVEFPVRSVPRCMINDLTSKTRNTRIMDVLLILPNLKLGASVRALSATKKNFVLEWSFLTFHQKKTRLHS